MNKDTSAPHLHYFLLFLDSIFSLTCNVYVRKDIVMNVSQYLPQANVYEVSNKIHTDALYIVWKLQYGKAGRSTQSLGLKKISRWLCGHSSLHDFDLCTDYTHPVFRSFGYDRGFQCKDCNDNNQGDVVDTGYYTKVWWSRCSRLL